MARRAVCEGAGAVSHATRRPIAWIVLAQLCGTSLWFSANSAADDLRRLWGLTTGDLGWLTNSVQAGFIVGTLTFALTGFADRHPASRKLGREGKDRDIHAARIGSTGPRDGRGVQ